MEGCRFPHLIKGHIVPLNSCVVTDGRAAWPVWTMLGEIEFEGLRCHAVPILHYGKTHALRKIGVVAKKKLDNSTSFITRWGALKYGAPTLHD